MRMDAFNFRLLFASIRALFAAFRQEVTVRRLMDGASEKAEITAETANFALTASVWSSIPSAIT